MNASGSWRVALWGRATYIQNSNKINIISILNFYHGFSPPELFAFVGPLPLLPLPLPVPTESNGLGISAFGVVVEPVA
jgi:hypothetical protein